MRRVKNFLSLLTGILLVFNDDAFGQSYFPMSGQNWTTIGFEEAGWCSDSLASLIQYLDQEDTKAFIVLYDGKILVEHYFDEFTADSLWYWASAGKSLTSSLVGIAQSEGSININSPVSTYLNSGWSSMTTEQENAVTVRHELTMTTGLNDNVSNDDCTLPSCLTYLAESGSRWAYHNAPYSLLYQVLQNATGVSINQFFTQKIGIPCGISGLYYPSGTYSKIFVSSSRDMAKFGLLLQAQGNWNGNQVIPSSYFQEMIAPSQEINDAYGYLTWLNTDGLYMVPGPQIQIPGRIAPSAPLDMYAGLGKNGQVVCAAPSKNLTFIRMGNGANDLISLSILENIWNKMQWFFCTTEVVNSDYDNFQVMNNGSSPSLRNGEVKPIVIFDSSGRLINNEISELIPGLYFVQVVSNGQTRLVKWVVGEN